MIDIKPYCQCVYLYLDLGLDFLQLVFVFLGEFGQIFLVLLDVCTKILSFQGSDGLVRRRGGERGGLVGRCIDRMHESRM